MDLKKTSVLLRRDPRLQLQVEAEAARLLEATTTLCLVVTLANFL